MKSKKIRGPVAQKKAEGKQEAGSRKPSTKKEFPAAGVGRGGERCQCQGSRQASAAFSAHRNGQSSRANLGLGQNGVSKENDGEHNVLKFGARGRRCWMNAGWSGVTGKMG